MSPQVKLLDPTDPESLSLCRQVFETALAPETRDDRLDTAVGDICAVAFIDDNAVGYCMGSRQSNGLLPLDLAIIPGNEAVARQLWDVAIAADGYAEPELWGRPAQPFHTQLSDELGLTHSRELFQMRAPLPLDLEPVATSAFRPGIDDSAWVEVNNASFDGHPEQGSWTVADLHARMTEPWFDADGFRLFFDDGTLAGFCWTKIHRREPLIDLGEIYVIGLAPSHHGQGLGASMTAAGLDWLASAGLTTAMLYVESNNAPAVATYERIGFSVFATYRAWGSQ